MKLNFSIKAGFNREYLSINPQNNNLKTKLEEISKKYKISLPSSKTNNEYKSFFSKMHNKLSTEKSRSLVPVLENLEKVFGGDLTIYEIEHSAEKNPGVFTVVIEPVIEGTEIVRY